MIRFKVIAAVLALASSAVFAQERVVYSAQGGKIKSFDPVLADDAASQYLAGAVFDTLLQYDYTARPYVLRPSMLAEMPVFSPDFRSCHFKLRKDLRFADDPVFSGHPEKRHITAEEVFYSLKRLCDPRLSSPVYWILRGKIRGMEQFRKAAAAAPRCDDSPYRLPVSGMVRHNDFEFTLHFNCPEPRILYLFAMPNTAVVSPAAVQRYGENFRRHPVGSGPFKVNEYISDYKLTLVRNPDYRKEFFPQAQTFADRTRPLPLADKVVIYTVKQPITAWLLFLQGKLDYHEMGKDDADLLTGGSLPSALRERGVKLLTAPSFEVRYIGFNFEDPVIGKNKKLRQALSLAYNVEKRIEHANFQLVRAHSPIPPGVAGHDPAWKNPYSADDMAKAKKLFAEGGFSPEKPLTLTFDQAGESTSHRQIAELTAAEFQKLGVRLEAVFNFRPRFFERLRRGKMQLFRLSWTGDYPDAENFLQLFYSGNAGNCNRTSFRSREFDALYEKLIRLPEGKERLELCRRAVAIVSEECPWIFEGYPVSYQLLNSWMENYLPHDFGFNRLKYLSVNPEQREKSRRAFKVLDFSQLRQP